MPARARRTLLLLALLLSAPTAGARGAPAAPLVDRTVALSDGRRIALHCSGQGDFTVLLETGDGGHRAHMAQLFDALSKRYRVCDYDRRNVGDSSAAAVPRRAAELAADPFDALAAVGESGPYLLFGTSMGGLLVRLHATTHAVAGFVTSNQPGTSGEAATWLHPTMSAAERAGDAAWAAGDNEEHIDVNDVSRVIDAAPAPAVPRVYLISTERHQCAVAGLCGASYRAFVAASRATARVGTNGRLRIVDGDHDLYVTHLNEVVKAIDAVAAAARAVR